MLQHIKNQVKGTRLEQVLGPLYTYGKYLASGGYGFEYEINRGAEMMTPAEWAGVDHEQKGEFFGYYDKTPWSSDMTSFLTHSIRGDGNVNLVLYDRDSSSRRVLADTCAWNYQQGSMLQWIEPEAAIYNDIVDNKLQSVIVDTQGNPIERHPVPVQTVSPNGDEFLAINYRKFDRINPQYGYGIAVDNFDSRMSYSDDGIWRVNRSTAEINLVLTLADVIQYDTKLEMDTSNHWINHVMYSPNGSKVVFMHRWGGSERRFSRLFVADTDGSTLRLLMDDELISHYFWKNNTELIVWGRGPKGDLYYHLNVETGEMETIGELNEYGDGHPSYSPNERWIVTDTYANDTRVRHLLLRNTKLNETIEAGKFHSPIRYRNEKSCDLHPRWNRDGTMISIDSTHEGQRSTHLLDVSEITNI